MLCAHRNELLHCKATANAPIYLHHTNAKSKGNDVSSVTQLNKLIVVWKSMKKHNGLIQWTIFVIGQRLIVCAMNPKAHFLHISSLHKGTS